MYRVTITKTFRRGIMKLIRTVLYAAFLAACLLAFPLDRAHADVTAYDAFGNFIGIFLGNSSTATGQIYIPSVDRFLHANMNTGELIGQDLFFESDDCSGSAYAAPEAAYNIIRNGDNYYTGERTPPADLQVNSALRSFNAACELFPGSRLVVPVQDISLPVNLPLALPLHFAIEKKVR